jgi:hypothetical protein
MAQLQCLLQAAMFVGSSVVSEILTQLRAPHRTSTAAREHF